MDTSSAWLSCVPPSGASQPPWSEKLSFPVEGRGGYFPSSLREGFQENYSPSLLWAASGAPAHFRQVSDRAVNLLPSAPCTFLRGRRNGRGGPVAENWHPIGPIRNTHVSRGPKHVEVGLWQLSGTFPERAALWIRKPQPHEAVECDCGWTLKEGCHIRELCSE